MSPAEYKYELPRNIDRYLAALSKLYAQEGERQLQGIIVNAQTRIQEEWSSDNWNGGTYGHALFLILPDVIYLPVARQKEELQERIRLDLEKLHNVQNQFIEKVFLEMDVTEDSDWRQKSGALLQGTRVVSEDATKRIWDDGQFRLFLSHKSDVKEDAAQLKIALSRYGISGFVAHSDIHPTQEWQDEIENALSTMDGFVALMTDTFHESDWTDQEVGYAFARSVPIIAARLGRDPYGFIGKFQGLSCTWGSAPEAIVKLLIRHDRMFAAYVLALKACPSFDRGNALAPVLLAIDKASDEQQEVLVEAYNSNPELRGSFGFNGSRPQQYGPGLLSHLNRWAIDRLYVANQAGTISWF